MPQGPIAVAGTNVIPQGAKSVKNITAATVIKATPGTIIAYAIIVAGSADGTVNDVATTGAAAVGNQLAVISHTAGIGIYDERAVQHGHLHHTRDRPDDCGLVHLRGSPCRKIPLP